MTRSRGAPRRRSDLSPDEHAQHPAPPQGAAQLAPHRPLREDDPGPIEITWYTVPNQNARSGGHMPMCQVTGGRRRGDTYGQGHRLVAARLLACEMAEEEAERYPGYERVTVRPRAEPPAKTSRTSFRETTEPPNR